MSNGVKRIETEAWKTSDGKAFLSLTMAHEWEEKLEERRLEELKTDQERLKPMEPRAPLDADGNPVEVGECYWAEVQMGNEVTWIELRVAKVTRGVPKVRVSRWHASPHELIEPRLLHRHHPNAWRNDGPVLSRATEAEELARLQKHCNPLPM